MGYKILVVDDEPDVLEPLCNKLKREGFDVSTARDGEEALLKVKEHNPDIILLDLNLPKLNGFEVLERVRKQFTDKWRPVIIISGQNDLESVKKCYAMEADHYLAKPVTVDKILQGIQTMLSLIPLRKKEGEA